MVPGRDFDATFAPTAAPTSIRVLAVLASRLRLMIKVADVETAFLVPKMDKVVYVRALLWYEQIAASIAGLPVPTVLPVNACRQLLKGVPGIKQGSRLFYFEITKVLLSLGFCVHPADPCIYFRLPTSSRSFVAVAVWVDDIFALVSTDAEWVLLLNGLRTSFSLSDKGDVKMFLGMEIVQSADRTTVTLSQRISIDNLLSRARATMKSQHPALTPCVAGFVFTKADSPAVPQPRPARMPEFRGLIALANYISVWTRPDITYVVNKLCKYMANPGDRHIDVFERLLRYLIATRDLGLVYVFDGSVAPLVAYSDSSHMDCVDTSRSTLAYLFFLFGQVVSWYSKLHTFVTTCSNHSEYAAMFQAAKEAQYLSNWLSPLLPLLQIAISPVPIFNDNDGASALAIDPVGRFKNKHVRMEHHYTQELVVAKTIVPVRVDTSENKSDLLTKALGPTVFPAIANSLVGPTSACPPARVLMLRVVDETTQVVSPAVGESGAAAESGNDAPILQVQPLWKLGHFTFADEEPLDPPASPSWSPRDEDVGEQAESPTTTGDPRLVRRVVDVSVQTDLLPEVGHAAVQCDFSSFDAFDGRVGDQNNGLSVRTLEAILSYSDRVCSVARALEFQRQFLLDAASDMHDHLDLIKSVDEPLRAAPVLPVVSNTEAKDSVSSGADDSDGPCEAGEQVEYFQNWTEPVAPLAPSAPVYTTTVAPTVHPIPPSVRACSYCRKGGHQAPQCRRRINDQSYMQVKPPPKRRRRGR